MGQDYSIGRPSNRPSANISSIDAFGHSWLDAATFTETPADQTNFLNIWAAANRINPNQVTNHAILGAQITGATRAAGGFAKALGELNRTFVTGQYPYTRMGGATLLTWGINEIGGTTPANQAFMRNDAQRCYTAIISKARAAQIHLAATSALWTFGTNFTTAAAAALDFTSGPNNVTASAAKQATVVDSAGTSTATFTIPNGYSGEPICFNMACLQGGSLVVTWGGTITNTSSIVGRTDTLNTLSVNAQSAYPVRFTAAANGLSASNAGQTITVRITTVSASTFTLDGCWIESFKPSPVLVCNVARLPEHTFNFDIGDAATGAVTTGLTSAQAAQFSSIADTGAALTELDAQGAIGGGLTISSVTNATTAVMSGNSLAAKTAVRLRIARRQRGYSSGTYYSVNTNFTSATAASHAAADTDVTNYNAMLVTVVALFDSMVQIVDLDAAIGSDINCPANVASFFLTNISSDWGLHFNHLGNQVAALALHKAANALRYNNDGTNLGVLEASASVGPYPAPYRQLVLSGGTYLPPFGSFLPIANPYVCVAGDMFAFPFQPTESNLLMGAFQVQQLNAPATAGSNIRCGLYDDTITGGSTLYPNSLRNEITSGGAVALGTTAGVKSLGSMGPHGVLHAGRLYWLVIKVDSLGTTASQLQAVTGPCNLLPPWSAAGGIGMNVAYKWTGQAAGALPNNMISGGVLVAGNVTPFVPAVGFVLTITQ